MLILADMPNSVLKVEKVRGESISWSGYLERIDQLLLRGLSTGPVQTSELLDKSKLNRQRMYRILKTAKIPEDISQLFSQIPSDVKFLVITEGWCGDAAQLLPYFQLMSESAKSKEQVRYVLRDETEYINDFLTNGSKSIPVIVAYDQINGQVISFWGPRTSSFTIWYDALKKSTTLTKDELSYQLHARYSQDKGSAFFEDMRAFISEILSKI